MPTEDGYITAADDRRAFNRLLDQLAEQRGYSDREMSVMIFNLSSGAVSQWRTGRSLPSNEQAMTLADALRLNQQYVVAIINRQRAESPVEKAMWEIIAERFKAALAALAIGAPLALVPSPAEARFDNNLIVFERAFPYGEGTRAALSGYTLPTKSWKSPSQRF